MSEPPDHLRAAPVSELEPRRKKLALMAVLGDVTDRGRAGHIARCHGYRAVFPVTVANLMTTLQVPGATVILLLLPLGECRGDALARALRRIHPRIPVALSLGASAIAPDTSRLLWLTSEPVPLDTVRAAAQIGALADTAAGDGWDGTTWEVDPLHRMAERAGRRVARR